MQQMRVYYYPVASKVTLGTVATKYLVINNFINGNNTCTVCMYANSTEISF
mgnify:FL=1